ncbi:DUF4180 domain-containing protein [Streptomyces sp. NBC_01498]|uniref:DUF4180 domain-containing protein n=1 Tax=Streptomyces sp. NBC_01498 TaxID=2975870 RepID=UPI002E7ABB03|nr:DUF4180 domain-containing protein [Streptomyces sp. NBC_01498]WTL26086.1 DUF4180 domain-containing protein [Streptomyces sp. NBC_01498]
MAEPLVTYHGVPVLVLDADGPPIATVQDALDLLVSSSYAGADLVAVPAGRFDDSFYDLSSGLAGEILQKLANYRLRLAVVGDISHHLRASKALPDLVRESNRGRDVWFVPDLGELIARLGR